MWRFSAIFVFVICLISVNCEPEVPCYFIFGDSYSDSGNNNNLITLAKANYPPYGVDFPGQIPTGRFTNGLNAADYIAQFLGFDQSIAPYRNQMDQGILRGVNFASGSAGILNETSYHVGDRVWMDRQLQNYETTISQLQSMVQGPVANYLNKCLYTVNIGTNDYINNYYYYSSPILYPTTQVLTADQYAALLIARYRSQLQKLYDSGARMVAVYGLGPLGCLPFELIKSGATQCVARKNQAVELFNTKLVSLVDDFNTRLPEAKFTFINVFAIQNITVFPGLITNSTCCRIEIVSNLCLPLVPPCANRNLYAFMDGIHPTDVVNKQVAIISYNGTQIPLFVRPMNIRQLLNN